MYVSKRKAVALLATAAFAGSAATGASALAHSGHAGRGGHGAGEHRDHDGRSVLRTSLAPSDPMDPMLFGVAPGALPWVIRVGRADLRRDGRLDVVIRGLVIPGAPAHGTPGPVTMVNASLYCNGSSTPAGTTNPPVPLSRAGDADIEAKLSLSTSKCLAPALLIHPNGTLTVYIAASGFTG